MDSGGFRQKKQRYFFPFADGMTEFDLLGVLFIHFDSRITNSHALKQITAEIMNACEEDIKGLKELKAAGEKWNFTGSARITDEDIAKRRRQLLVYSPYTVTKALMRISDKRLAEMPLKERYRYLHQCAVEFDKQRIESSPNKCYALCKENEGNPLALKRPKKSAVELKHELMMRDLEKDIKEGKYSDDWMEKEAKKVQDVASVHRGNHVWTDDDKSDWCAMNDGSNPEFCIFDLLA